MKGKKGEGEGQRWFRGGGEPVKGPPGSLAAGEHVAAAGEWDKVAEEKRKNERNKRS